MVQPASSFSSVTVEVARIVCGVKFIVPSCAESAMAKHPACAAPINSSGFVPFSNRVRKEYGASDSTPLCVEMEPLPSFTAPVQIAVAVRCMLASMDVEIPWKIIGDKALVRLRPRRSRRCPIHHLKVLADTRQAVSLHVFVYSKCNERDHGHYHPQFRASGNFGLGFPAKKLTRDFERYENSDRQGDQVGDNFAVGRKIRRRIFKAGGEICSRHKQRSALNPVREPRQRYGRSGKK